MGVISKASKKEYGAVPPRRVECWYFLDNVGIVHEDERDGRFYFDSEQAAYVLGCCEARREPETLPKDRSYRIDQLKEALMRGDREQNEEPETEAGEDAALDAEESAPPAVVPKLVMYLTPIELDIWESIVIKVARVEAGWRLGVLENPEELHAAWAAGALDCDPEEYFESLQRFVRHGVLIRLGDTSQGGTYLLREPPGLYHAVKIGDRPTLRISRDLLDPIREVQETGPRIQDRGDEFPAELLANIRERFPQLDPQPLMTACLGYAPGDLSDLRAIGIVSRHEEHGAWLTCVRGFEPFEAEAIAPAVQPMANRAPVSTPPSAAPSRPPPPERKNAAPPKPVGTAKRLMPAEIERLPTEDLEARLSAIMAAMRDLEEQAKQVKRIMQSRLEASIANRKKEEARLAALLAD